MGHLYEGGGAEHQHQGRGHNQHWAIRQHSPNLTRTLSLYSTTAGCVQGFNQRSCPSDLVLSLAN